MITSLIAAMDNNGGIGYKNGMPWERQVPADMKRFRELTMNHTVIMGHATWRSMGGKPLPKRDNIVLSRTPGLKLEGAGVCHTIEEALEAVRILCPEPNTEVFILGGGTVYAEVLEKKLVDRMYLTEISGDFTCDTHFPQWDPGEWRHLQEKDLYIPADDKNKFALQFLTLERIGSPNL